MRTRSVILNGVKNLFLRNIGKPRCFADPLLPLRARLCMTAKDHDR